MARKARAEVEGGLYHVITRGNNRRQIFNAPADYEKSLSLLAVQKAKPTAGPSRIMFSSNRAAVTRRR
jgi:REP element-mobilizing transposase RayT